jgi:hypothetical protein
MEYSGAAYAVILSYPDLRQRLLGQAHHPRRSALTSTGSQALRGWLAKTLCGLALVLTRRPAAWFPDRPGAV